MICVELLTRGLDLSRVDAGKILAETVDRVGGLAFREVQSRAPLRTGTLRNSVRLIRRAREAEVAVGASYAPFVEYGTVPHEIRPVHASSLRFEVEGEVVFAKLVRHPGTGAQRFVEAATREVAGEISRIFAEVFREAMK